MTYDLAPSKATPLDRVALVTHGDKARWFRSRMRWHAREWRTWQPLADYAEPALRRAIALRDMALFHEKWRGV